MPNKCNTGEVIKDLKIIMQKIESLDDLAARSRYRDKVRTARFLIKECITKIEEIRDV